jgi:arylsulfatase A-like enzyme/Flp pilus assembly protein TadD
MRFSKRLFGLFFFSICAVGAGAPGGAAARPNIILITLDTTRADRMGFLGSERGLTPSLDNLARQSVVFTRAYAHVPLTPPSHATILTGTYPQFNHLTYMGEPLSKTVPDLPDILRGRGYRTVAFVGSMILDPKNATANGFERGFDVYDAGFHQSRKGEDRYKSVERRAGEVVDRALSWLNKNPSGPYFMWVHCYDPHAPYDPPEPYRSKFPAAPYDGEIAYTDSAMGVLLNALRARGLYENSMIVIVADHGEAFGEHGERHHGVFLYDETVRVPLLIKLPRERSGGLKVEARAGLVDIAPTALQVAGIPVPAAIQGSSLLSVIKAPKSEENARQQAPERPAYAESIYAHRAFGWSVLRAWRAGKYLYVQAPERELYDQAADIKAAHNLAGSAQAVADTMATQLDDFRSKTSSAVTEQVALNPEQAENLRSLGYLPSTATSVSSGELSGLDPKDHIEVANLLTEALFDTQEDRYQEAIPKLLQVLKQEPHTNLAYLELGRAYVHLKDYEQALPLLKEAVTRLPEDGLAHYELGRVLVETGDWADAAPQFEAAVQRTPKSPELHFYLAVTYERAHQVAQAMKEFETTIALDPNHFRANLLLGRMLGMQQKPANALPYLRKAVKLQPDSAEAHQFLANVYTELGQQTNARRERAEAERLKAPASP